MKLLEKLKIIWKIFMCDEYFLTVAYRHNPYGRTELGPIRYEYFTNSNRELFWTFIKDHIENTKRSITGNFVCVKDYKIDDLITIKSGTQIYIKDGYVTKYDMIYKIPTEEIHSHFKYDDI